MAISFLSKDLNRVNLTLSDQFKLFRLLAKDELLLCKISNQYNFLLL